MNIYTIAILTVIIGNWILSLVIERLNLGSFTSAPPEGFEDFFDPEKYAASQSYLGDNARLGLVSDTFTTAALLFMILTGFFGWIDSAARTAGYGEITSGLIFGGILILILWALGLPFGIYRTFVIEEKYGFNKTTPAVYVADIVKSWVLTVLIGAPLFAGILWFFLNAGSPAWVYGWIFVSVFQLVIVYLAPSLIMPLFNRFEPLEEGELREQIEKYAAEHGFALKGIFRMDGSKRSMKTNAFFTGFGKSRRIVLFDTLIEKHPPDEIVCILAHEIGHYKKKHLAKGMAVSVLTAGIMFFLLSLFIWSSELTSAFGLRQHSVYAGMIFFGFLYSPVSLVLSLFGNALSRKNEREADAFAAETCAEPAFFANALKRISSDNLANLTPHRLKVIFEYSHPPTPERVNAVMARSPAPPKPDSE